MQILGFSPRVLEAGREFLAEHPVIEIKVQRAADFGSQPVYLAGGLCEECGWTWSPDKVYLDALSQGFWGGEELMKGYLPRDYLESIEWTHAWDQASRSHYCGGHIALTTSVVRPY